MRFLLTGTAGFIGFHLARRLLADGHLVVGVDGFTSYYDVGLKRDRHAILSRNVSFRPVVAMLEDSAAIEAVVGDVAPEIIIHLAAQAGVRYSIENPRAYLESNVDGLFNLLEAAQRLQPRHLLLASSSSVYGANASSPFRETDRTDHPLTVYAATKKAGEDLAHAYAHIWGLPITALRFFTVYGPWGRPDMALSKFVAAALEGRPIDVYGQGTPQRDFTYVDDVVESILRLIDRPPRRGDFVGEEDSLSPAAPYRVVNVGAGRTVGLFRFIEEIERCLGVPIAKRLLAMQKGDVPSTFASVDLLERLTGYRPHTGIDVGVLAFVEWFRAYYGSRSTDGSHAAIS